MSRQIVVSSGNILNLEDNASSLKKYRNFLDDRL